MTAPRIITAAERAARKAAQNQIGLGDMVASVATPIARIFSLPCIDPVTKQLRPESPCAKRKAKMNQVMPNINPLG